MSVKSIMKKIFVSQEVETIMDKIPSSVGSFGYDPWGMQTDSAKIGMGLFKWLYDHYFRVETHGLKNIPKDGRVLVIANHSGQLPFDGTLIGIAVATNPPGPRAPRAMIERFFPTVPFIGNLLNQLGAVIGDPVNCVRMLKREEAVVVFPEGVRGSGKLYIKRYQIQRFGHGFMHLAIENNTPIIPVGVVGCEETIPAIANISPLAKVLGIPYVPVAIPFPLPAKVILNFGEPMRFTGDIESEQKVRDQVEEVKDAIRGLIDKGLSERKERYF